MIHCWCLPFQFPLNISVDKAAPTLCLEGDGRNNTFFSVLAYGTLNQIFSHSLQTPFPKGKTQQNPGSVHQLRQVIFLLAKCTQPAKWMSIFESFCENSKMRLVSQKKRVLSRVYFIVQIREGFYKGLQGFCLSVLGFAMRAGSASQSSAYAQWATTAGHSSERANQGTAGFSFV